MLKKLLFALITVACCTILTSCERETNAASEPIAVPVQVRTPAVVERAESVTASGSVEGSETADVAFLVGGTVARVLVEEGQHVSKGQLLAEIEPTDYRNAFNAADAQKTAALLSSRRPMPVSGNRNWSRPASTSNALADEYKRMKFLVERKSLPPNDFQKIEAAYNAVERALRDGAGGHAERRSRHSHCTSTCRGRPGEPKKGSGSTTRDSSRRFPATYQCVESTLGRQWPPECRSSRSSTSIR